MLITPEQLRAWAGRLSAGGADDVMDVAQAMRVAADELAKTTDPPDARLLGVPMLPPNLYGYPPNPRFLRADRWPVDGYKGRWYLMGAATELLDAETVDVKQFSGSTTTVAPLEPVAWRMVQKKGRGKVLYVLMTFERAVYEQDEKPLGGEPTTR